MIMLELSEGGAKYAEGEAKLGSPHPLVAPLLQTHVKRLLVQNTCCKLVVSPALGFSMFINLNGCLL